MASFRQRKKEVYRERSSEQNMPRGGRTQLQIYTPGSGPLRKSANREIEDPSRSGDNIKNPDRSNRIRRDNIVNDDGDSAHRMDSNTNERRRSKKPEQSFFVPTVVAKARESEQRTSCPKQETGKEWNMNGNNNSSNERSNSRSKRYLNRRRPNDSDIQEEWRGPSPNRNYRQGSESRVPHHQNSNNWNRTRDTRSVEPQMNSNNRGFSTEKFHPKPPSGRRHSTIGLEQDKKHKYPQKMEDIPPRFRKKYLDENKMSHLIGNQTEESWDGSSITFQGTAQHNYHQKQYNYPSNQHVTPNNKIYSTLPTRARGRGRLDQEFVNPPGWYGSPTPDKINSPVNSRPTTPSYSTRTRSNENLNRIDSRSRTPVNVHRYERNRYDRRNDDERYGGTREEKRNDNHEVPRNGNNRRLRESLEAQLSPVSPSTPEEGSVKGKFDIIVNNDILDWSEEVELHVKNLEAEALSDALTRSSSMASLMETSTKSLPANTTQRPKKRKIKKKRSGSHQRERSSDNQNRIDDYHKNTNANRRTRKNSQNTVDPRDNFKVPDPHMHARSRESVERSYDVINRSKNVSREPSFDRNRKSSCSEHENWRDEIRGRSTIERDIPSKKEEVSEGRKGGLIHLPQSIKDPSKPPVLNLHERPKLPEMQRKPPGQKTLFDPNNPHTPIVINKPNSRVNCPGFSENSEAPSSQLTTTDQYGNNRPMWLNEYSENATSCRFPQLLSDIIRAENELQNIINSGQLVIDSVHVTGLRQFLMDSLEYLLQRDTKFSQTENIEQHFWKILYYNIIEMTRKAIVRDPENKGRYKELLLDLIDEGTKFYEKLLDGLESTFNFKLTNYLGSNCNQKAVGFINLALVSAQKIFICLGDLWRYKEQVNETSNYGKCRQMYLKAHEINPKNGRPYNQLAVLAMYSRKKLDAVYYYMRSLMSTNAIPSAKEQMNSLFDENRKKYEHSERKRREERIERAKMHMKEKESENAKHRHGSLRKETWIRPDGGRRVHRTTSTLQDSKIVDSEEEDLAALSSVEVNKRFVTSYLHVHGKLITKIGLETFQETALQMLKEFRALLQHSPLPLPSTRFLQLLALNMFAIETTQLKDQQIPDPRTYRSELQERALVVSLQMFNLILEKCIALLNDHAKNDPDNTTALSVDAHELLPAIKVWCDWMLCHTNIWNPPPSTQDFSVGPGGDAWTRLATLMNLLEKLDQSITIDISSASQDGHEQVRLPEDAALSGFTPLMLSNDENPSYVSKTSDMDTAQFAVRIKKIIFFGTIFLCGMEPPVLKLEYQDDFSEYISVVCTSANRSAPNTPPEFNESGFLVESFSEDEGIEEGSAKAAENPCSEIQELLSRKVELEKRQRDQELHRQTVQKILQQSVVSVHIEVKPKNLVPDTNCFIDYLVMLKRIAASNVYTLMVPLIVLNELEGLTKGSKSPASTPRNANETTHAVKVAESAKEALAFLNNRNPSVKCITTKGTILTSTTFTKEDDTLVDVNTTNDDRILSTCMTLCKGNSEQILGEPRKLYREVVLLTEDRNLRVKALARDVPVREVPSFLQWAGLG